MQKKAISTGIFLAGLGIFAQSSAELINCNPDPKGSPWYAAASMPEFTKEDSILVAGTPSFKSPRGTRAVLPVRVDNSVKPAFRSIFDQIGNSCGSASSIGYAFAYEMNTARGTSATTVENQYPYLFTYNLIVGDGVSGSWYWDAFSIAKKMGIPTAKAYGGFDRGTVQTWANGYDVYHNAMTNKASNYYKIKVNTPQGLNDLKRWMYDHGRGDAAGGVAIFSAMAFTSNVSLVNTEGYTNEYVVEKWGDNGYHAMTFVGYDDSIPVKDYNGDGKFTNDIDVNNDNVVDMKDWERGALKIVNSWGNQWGKNGTGWFPYSSIARWKLDLWPFFNDYGITDGEVWVVDAKPVSTPTRTLKVNMQSQNRGALKMYVGASTSASSTPETVVEFTPAFSYSGKVLPIQGDGIDTLEFGLDLTEVAEKLGVTGNFRRFFLVVEGSESNAGNLKALSLIDYSSGQPMEIKTTYKSVAINAGVKYFPIDLNIVPPHTITASAGSGGTISPAGAVAVADGADQTFTITGSLGYGIDYLVVDNVSKAAANSYTFTDVTVDHSISAVFKTIPTHTVTASAHAGGTISPNGTMTVNEGDSRTFTVTPDKTFRIDSVKVNGSKVVLTANQCTISNIRTNSTVEAWFGKAPTYTIFVDGTSGGTVTPAGNSIVDSLGSLSCTFTASAGNMIDSIVVDGKNCGAVTSYQFTNVESRHFVTAYFGQSKCTDPNWDALKTYATSGTKVSYKNHTWKNKWYANAGNEPGVNQVWEDLGECSGTASTLTIIASAVGTGKISPNGVVSITSGASQTFTLIPDDGSKFDSLLVEGTKTPVSGLTYTAANVTSNKTVIAYFSANSSGITLTASVVGTGNISPKGAVSIVSGGSQTFTLIPDNGSKFDSLLVDGMKTPVSGLTYTVSNVTSSKTVAAYFSGSVLSAVKDTTHKTGTDSVRVVHDTTLVANGDSLVRTTTKEYLYDSLFVKTDSLRDSKLFNTKIDTTVSRDVKTVVKETTLRASVAVIHKNTLSQTSVELSVNPAMPEDTEVQFIFPEETIRVEMAILDVTGNSVFSAKVDSKSVIWNLNNQKGNRISGSFKAVGRITMTDGTVKRWYSVVGVQK